MNEEIKSGLLEDVRELEPGMVLSGFPGDGREKSGGGDSDGTDTGDSDGTDNGDADGTDNGDAGGTERDGDATDGATDGTDGATDGDGTDGGNA